MIKKDNVLLKEAAAMWISRPELIHHKVSLVLKPLTQEIAGSQLIHTKSD